MKSLRWLLPLFLIALAIRTHGATWLPPTAAEASGDFQSLLLPLAEFRYSRIVCALCGSLAASIVCGAFFARVSRPTLVAGAAVALSDPLSIAASREAGPGGPLALAGALLTLLLIAPPMGRKARLLVGALAAVVLAFAIPADRTAIAAFPRDATLTAWDSVCGSWFGPACLLIHHVGYAAAPLALIGLSHRTGRRLAILLPFAILAALWVDGGQLHRLSVLAAVSPVAVALLFLTLDRVARADRLSSRSALGVLGMAGLVIAVNLPVLVSDLKSGQRFPWPPALQGLAALDPVLPPETPVYTSTPTPLEWLSNRPIRMLPPDLEQVEALLGGPRPLVFLLPVEGGEVHGVDDPGVLRLLEGRSLPAFEIRVKRFDLYRYEVRAFVFR
ncbi:MAG: hypothetical protein V2A76_01270 [Planctomycetota bacterium]